MQDFNVNINVSLLRYVSDQISRKRCRFNADGSHA